MSDIEKFEEKLAEEFKELFLSVLKDNRQNQPENKYPFWVPIYEYLHRLKESKCLWGVFSFVIQATDVKDIQFLEKIMPDTKDHHLRQLLADFSLTFEEHK